MVGAWLIRRAELIDGRTCDVRIAAGRIAEVGGALAADGATEIDAGGALLLPGLHDHHLHLAAMAAAMASVRCGPPEVSDAEGLAAALAAAPGEGWLRGVGYHESVAGLVDRHWLDRARPDRPVRVQHRSGRLWVVNSAGLARLLAAGEPPPGLEREGGAWTGRLYDEDAWLRRALAAAPPPLAAVGSALVRCGVTGVTDMTPDNDGAAAEWLAGERRSGALPQRVLMAGRPGQDGAGFHDGVRLGPVKLHLHEAHLPDFDATVAMARAAHAEGRPLAAHCVTEVELVFTLAALREAGALAGDRIEHASVAPDDLVAQIADLGLAVVAQPNFVSERGDAYRAAIPEAEWPHLYRLAAFRDAGVTLAGGSDAPFGGADPWAAMAAAVSRRTARGESLGEQEALTPEEALRLFLADPVDLGRTRTVATGEPADLCLLAVPWRVARRRLSADLLRAVFVDGRRAHDRIDEAEAQGARRADALAGEH